MYRLRADPPPPKEKSRVSLWGMSKFIWRWIVNITLHCVGSIVPMSTITNMSQCKTLLRVSVAYTESLWVLHWVSRCVVPSMLKGS
jgi:hypothetical protein